MVEEGLSGGWDGSGLDQSKYTIKYTWQTLTLWRPLLMSPLVKQGFTVPPPICRSVTLRCSISPSTLWRWLLIRQPFQGPLSIGWWAPLYNNCQNQYKYIVLSLQPLSHSSPVVVFISSYTHPPNWWPHCSKHSPRPTSELATSPEQALPPLQPAPGFAPALSCVCCTSASINFNQLAFFKVLLVANPHTDTNKC